MSVAYNAKTHILHITGDHYYTEVVDIKAAHEARPKGNHWFSPETMRYWNCRYLVDVYHGCVFVSSEKGPDGVRLYTLRAVTEDAEIETVGEFQGYATASQAKKAAKALVVVRA